MRYLIGLLASLCGLAQTTAVIFPDTSRFGTNVTTCAMSAANDMCAMILRVPKTGTISKVWVRVGGVSTAATLSVSIQTVSTADGFPTGTNYGGSSPGTITSPTASTWYEVTLGAAANATAGDLVAVVVAFASTAGNLSIAYYNSALCGFGYAARYSTSWTKNAYTPVVGLVYSDGSVEGRPDALPALPSSVSFNAGSTPDERGICFKSPVTGKVISLSFHGSVPSGADFEIVLYDSSNTILASVAASASQVSGATGPYTFSLSSPPTISAGTWYRLTLRPSTATSVTVYPGTFPNATVRDGYFRDVYYTYRTDGGAWAEDQSVVYRLWVTVTDIAAGGGTGACGGSIVVCY